jgi:hypothetical protein
VWRDRHRSAHADRDQTIPVLIVCAARNFISRRESTSSAIYRARPRSIFAARFSTLTYSFVESVKASYPFWTIRFIGGAMFLGGMLIMFYNMVKTIAGQKAYDAPVLAPAAAHA